MKMGRPCVLIGCFLATKDHPMWGTVYWLSRQRGTKEEIQRLSEVWTQQGPVLSRFPLAVMVDVVTELAREGV